jgi:hypothetical protein
MQEETLVKGETQTPPAQDENFLSAELCVNVNKGINLMHKALEEQNPYMSGYMAMEALHLSFDNLRGTEFDDTLAWKYQRVCADFYGDVIDDAAKRRQYSYELPTSMTYSAQELDKQQAKEAYEHVVRCAGWGYANPSLTAIWEEGL